MWLDGIYMLDVFYARWIHSFEPTNNTAWDDIALQVKPLSFPFGTGVLLTRLKV